MFATSRSSSADGWDGSASKIAVPSAPDEVTMRANIAASAQETEILITGAESPGLAIGKAVTAFLDRLTTRGDNIVWVPNLQIQVGPVTKEETPS